MATVHTSGALGSGPALKVVLEAGISSRSTSSITLAIAGYVYYTAANSFFASAYSQYQLTAGFYIGGTWYEVAMPFNSNAGKTMGAGTLIASGSTTKTISVGQAAGSITISNVRTRSSGNYTIGSSGIMSSRTPNGTTSFSYNAITYSVSYNANGGSGAPAKQTYSYGGSNIYLSSQIPTRAGYNFLGWSLSSTATSPSYYAGQEWSSRNGSDYTLYAVWEVANGKSTITLSGSTINLDSLFTIYNTMQYASNTHTIVLTLPTGSYTLATGVGASHTFTLPASTWARYLTNSKSVDGTITVTTYSGSTNLGSVSQNVAVTLPEDIGKPDKPIVILSSEHAASATIDLKKPTFKYGATLKEWQVETNIGKAKAVGNRIHLGVDPTINKTGVVTVRAVDSRGFMSDPVSVQWHKRKTGGRIFIDGMWK